MGIKDELKEIGKKVVDVLFGWLAIWIKSLIDKIKQSRKNANK